MKFDKIKKHCLYFAIFYIFSFILGRPYASSGESYEHIPKVFIVTLSGVRNSDSINDSSHQYVAHLWNEMLRNGVLYSNLVNSNSQLHMAPFEAIHDGNIHLSYSPAAGLSSPSLFQYVIKKYNLPQNKVWSIGQFTEGQCFYGTKEYPKNTCPRMINSILSCFPEETKKEIESFLNKQELDFIDSYSGISEIVKTEWPMWGSLAKVQKLMFKKIVFNLKPVFIHFIMHDVEIAHYGAFGDYVLALKDCDKSIYEIWQFIQADPFYKGSTYLIVNIDITRDSYYMSHDENSWDNPSHVWLYIFGPGIKRGAVINRPVYHQDIFATVAYLMKIETHPTQGSLLVDSFIDVTKRDQ